MKEKKITQAELVTKSGLSRTTISRIFRDSNDKGSSYQAESLDVVNAVCIGLGIFDAGVKRAIFYAAFPQFSAWEHIDEMKMNIIDANIYLYDQGLPLLEPKRKPQDD